VPALVVGGEAVFDEDALLILQHLLSQVGAIEEVDRRIELKQHDVSIRRGTAVQEAQGVLTPFGAIAIFASDRGSRRLLDSRHRRRRF
jgi:hypothetical protein